MVSEREAYRLLGVSPDATAEEVRAAFRRKVMEQHPDTAVGGSDESGVRDLVDAYRVLAVPGSPPDSVDNLRRGSGTEGRRIRVGYGPGAEPAGPKRVKWHCPACAGTGLRGRNVTCPECRGSARVTTIDMDRARVSWCAACRGRGQRRVVARCHVCDGSGTAPSNEGTT